MSNSRCTWSGARVMANRVPSGGRGLLRLDHDRQALRVHELDLTEVEHHGAGPLEGCVQCRPHGIRGGEVDLAADHDDLGGPLRMHGDAELRARNVAIIRDARPAYCRGMAVLDALEHPIVQAPLAGGPSTPALAAAVCEAGGLGFLAAGYKPVDTVRADLEALRELTARPFGLNLFAPPAAPADAAAVRSYAATLEGESDRRGVALGSPRRDDDGWEEKLALAVAERVPRRLVHVRLPGARGDRAAARGGGRGHGSP